MGRAFQEVVVDWIDEHADTDDLGRVTELVEHTQLIERASLVPTYEGVTASALRRVLRHIETANERFPSRPLASSDHMVGYREGLTKAAGIVEAVLLAFELEDLGEDLPLAPSSAVIMQGPMEGPSLSTDLPPIPKPRQRAVTQT